MPPDAFLTMLAAVRGSAVPALQMRKWIQLLINRSLVLNTWEVRGSACIYPACETV